jgi:hypothetical protein
VTTENYAYDRGPVDWRSRIGTLSYWTVVAATVGLFLYLGWLA